MQPSESNKAIARTLDINHGTVKLHVRHILAKLNLSSRVEAAVFAVEHRAAQEGREAVRQYGAIRICPAGGKVAVTHGPPSLDR